MENSSRGTLGRAIVFGFVGDWAILLGIHWKSISIISKVVDFHYDTIF
jgi:hypothetical protein